jgi:hypothetical protein
MKQKMFLLRKPNKRFVVKWWHLSKKLELSPDGLADERFIFRTPWPVINLTSPQNWQRVWQLPVLSISEKEKIIDVIKISFWNILNKNIGLFQDLEFLFEQNSTVYKYKELKGWVRSGSFSFVLPTWPIN